MSQQQILDKKIIWIGAFPVGESNMGDQAQTFAINKFFKNNFPEAQVVKFNRRQIHTKEQIEQIKNAVSDCDLIFLHSSGDFGSQYYYTHMEYKDDYYHWNRRKIISAFPNNIIYHLPTTVNYDNSENGLRTLNEDINFYKDIDKFTLFCREEVSYRIIKNNLKCNSRFFPDFVFYLKPKKNIDTSKKNIILNLRTDDESRFNADDINKIEERVQIYFPEIKSENIHKAPKDLTQETLEYHIDKINEKYSSAELVVTDQMHSMIFSVINKIPCIALDDKIPHKLSGYKNILNKSVKFADSIEKIPSLIEEARSEQYKETNFDDYFNSFVKEIRDLLQ